MGPTGPRGYEPPKSPRRPRSRRWRLTFLVVALAIGFALVMGGNALAHAMLHASGIGGCGGG
ncbi:MAG: hypothetical protein ACJ76P_11295 [Actinomycetota bacterium]